MAIYSGSRYENSTVDYLSKTPYGKAYPIVFFNSEDLTNISFFTHITLASDTWHGLAQQYFQNPSLWWAIAEYNPELKDFIHFPVGTTIRIPSV